MLVIVDVVCVHNSLLRKTFDDFALDVQYCVRILMYFCILQDLVMMHMWRVEKAQAKCPKLMLM